MLMQNFKSAADLGITEPQLSALQKTLVLLETEKLFHYRGHYLHPVDRADIGRIDNFSMRFVAAKSDCGSAGCICGIAESLGGDGLGNTHHNPSLYDLFCPEVGKDWGNITPAQAATALRSYLTTGDARWDLAVA